MHLAKPSAAVLAVLLTLGAASDAAGADIVHVVAKGQTLVAIAKRYRTTPDTIREANGLRPGQLIHPGLELRVPVSSKAASSDAAASRTLTAGGKLSKVDPQSSKSQPAGYVRRPRRPGQVHLVRGGDHAEIQLTGRHGRLNPSALGTLSQVLRFDRSGAKAAIDPRLATLIAMVSDHFGGRPIHVVSGYRPYSPTQYTKDSNHNHGRAIDFYVEGVPNTVVRDFCRGFRNAGVGYYPNSTFVHLDARAGRVFWIDYSRPGEPPRYATPADKSNADDSPGDVVPSPRMNGEEDHHTDPHGGSNRTP
jgi:uncharacterized protein YcbK (DUF882 family)